MLRYKDCPNQEICKRKRTKNFLFQKDPRILWINIFIIRFILMD